MRVYLSLLILIQLAQSKKNNKHTKSKHHKHRKDALDEQDQDQIEEHVQNQATHNENQQEQQLEQQQDHQQEEIQTEPSQLQSQSTQLFDGKQQKDQKKSDEHKDTSAEAAEKKDTRPVARDNSKFAKNYMRVLAGNGKQIDVPVIKPEDYVCNLVQYTEYQLCAELKDCDLCSNISVCGWCQETQQCVPGSYTGAKCPKDCLAGWVFNDPTQCTGKVKAGFMSNVHPTSTELITPELASPKIRKTTQKTETFKQHHRALLGTVKVSQMTDNDGHRKTKIVQKPFMGDLVKESPIKNTYETAIYDRESNERLDQRLEKLVLHGKPEERK